MDRVLGTIGTVLLVAILFIGIGTLAAEFMGYNVLQTIHEYVSGFFNLAYPNATVTVEAINGQLVEGTKTVHWYVENYTAGTYDVAKVTVTTDKAVRLVLEVESDISGVSFTATIDKVNAIIVKDVEQVGEGSYLLKITIYPAYVTKGATVPENVTEYTTEVTVTISVTLPEGATGYVSVRVADLTLI